jgi:hypothetical protein
MLVLAAVPGLQFRSFVARSRRDSRASVHVGLALETIRGRPVEIAVVDRRSAALRVVRRSSDSISCSRRCA